MLQFLGLWEIVMGIFTIHYSLYCIDQNIYRFNKNLKILLISNDRLISAIHALFFHPNFCPPDALSSGAEC